MPHNQKLMADTLHWRALILYTFYAFSFAEKSAIASDILICCGQTASQLRHPIQAVGCFSSGTAINAIGAKKPPPVKQCSL